MLFAGMPLYIVAYQNMQHFLMPLRDIERPKEAEERFQWDAYVPCVQGSNLQLIILKKA